MVAHHTQCHRFSYDILEARLCMAHTAMVHLTAAVHFILNLQFFLSNGCIKGSSYNEPTNTMKLDKGLQLFFFMDHIGYSQRLKPTDSSVFLRKQPSEYGVRKWGLFIQRTMLHRTSYLPNRFSVTPIPCKLIRS